MARPIIPPSDNKDLNKVSTKICIDLTLFSALRGLNNLKILKKDTFLMYYSSREETTTMKSSQFQASFK